MKEERRSGPCACRNITVRLWGPGHSPVRMSPRSGGGRTTGSGGAGWGNAVWQRSWRPHTFRENGGVQVSLRHVLPRVGAGADQRLSALSQHGGPGRRLTDDDEHAEARQRLEPPLPVDRARGDGDLPPLRLRGLLASLLPTQAVAPVGKIGPVRIGSSRVKSSRGHRAPGCDRGPAAAANLARMTSALFEAPPTTRVQDGGLTAIVAGRRARPHDRDAGRSAPAHRGREAIGGE